MRHWLHRWHRRHHGGPPWGHPHHPHGCHGHGPHRRLFWRVYLHGILLLIAVTLAVGILGMVLGRGRNAWGQAAAFRQTLEAGGPAMLADGAALQSMVERVGERANADVTIYGLDGQVLASNVEPPLPPLAADVTSQLGSEPIQVGRHRWTLVLPLRHEGELMAYGIAEWRGPGAREIARGFSFFGAVLLALALGSIPLVRTIVSPLEKLTRAARALGKGELSTRSGIRPRKDEVGQLAAAFDEMAERLERLVRNERELLANVSHELRTPLSRIRVALELAAEGDAERARAYMKEIGSDLAELEQLIEDVLTASRLDAQAWNGDRFPLHPEPVSAADLLEQAARRFREAWPERTLEVDLAPDLPVLQADPVLLRRVFDNLLDNARKYSEAHRPVTLVARRERGALVVEVTDQGIGMTEEDLRQLFTPFFRSDRSRARGTGGVGLGLALAKRIVSAHQGTLTARSRVGEGTTFTVTLPASPSA